MTRARMVVVLTAVCIALTGSVIAADKDDAKVKVPKAKTVLGKVVKNLVKAKSFNVTCDVLGGMSKTADHAVSQVTVTQNYQGEVYRSLLHVPAHNAIRTNKRGSGAIRTGGNWVRLLSVRSGALMDGLFLTPQNLVAPILKSAKKIEWIYVGDEKDIVEEAPAKKGEKGSTAVVDDKQAFKGMPHVIRVELREKVSIDQFIAVQNSGCMGGG
jgi:hypothetical protein